MNPSDSESVENSSTTTVKIEAIDVGVVEANGIEAIIATPSAVELVKHSIATENHLEVAYKSDAVPLMTSSPKIQWTGGSVVNLKQDPISTIFDQPQMIGNSSYLSSSFDDSQSLNLSTALKIDLSSDDDDDDGSMDGESLTNEISPGDNLTNSTDEGQSTKSSGSKSRRKSDRILPESGDDGNERYTCPVCAEVMLGNHDFTKHIRQHNTSAIIPTINTCTICGKILSSQSSLDRHMLVHSGERPFRCRVCHMAFTTNGNMHRHMRIHEKDFPMSGESSQDGISIKDMSHRSRKKKISVVVEGENSRDFSPENLFLAGAQNGPQTSRKRRSSESISQSPRKQFRDKDGSVFVLNCPKQSAAIPVTAASSTVSPNGRIILEPVDIDLNASSIKCPICHQNFFSVYGLNNHLSTHDKYRRSRLLIRCSRCNLGWTNLLQYENHVKTVHRKKSDEKLEVEEAQLSSADVKPMNETKKSKENKNQSTNNTGLYFDLCALDFSSEKFPLIDKVYCEKYTRKSGAEKNGSKACKTCDHTFSCAASLSLHMISHKPDCTTVCEHCERVFSSVRQLKEHSLKHETEQIISGYSSVEPKIEESEISENLSQDEFLLVMGLKVSKPPASRSTLDVAGKKDPKVIEIVTSSGTNAKLMQVDANQNVITMTSPLSKILLKSPQMGNVIISSTQIPRVGNLIQQGQLIQSGKISGSNLNPIFINRSLFQQGNLTSLPMSQQKLAAVLTGLVNKQSALINQAAGAGVFRATGVAVGANDARILPPTVTSPDSNLVQQVGEEGSQQGANEGGTDKDDGGGPYVCSVCSEVFHNHKLFKGHLRTHVALTPFRCTQCSYASTDKSTLIRHLRTHNGERPFHCQLCHFAFTTKANCERHVRKKHSIEDKDAIENSISFHRVTGENGHSSATPGGGELVGISPISETVCKYCGEDFKFSRALKHHVRSQTSCQHKPYLCELCDIGFSTKANCIRHIQRQHSEVDTSKPEAHMKIKVELLEAQARMEWDENGEAPSTIPKAHGVKRCLESPNQNEFEDESINLTIDRNTQYRPQSAKLNYDSNDQPLDFSLKSSCETLDLSAKSSNRTAEVSNAQISPDQPMDLTCKGSAKSNLVENSGSARFIQIWGRNGVSTSVEEIVPINYSEPLRLLAKPKDVTASAVGDGSRTTDSGQDNRICRVLSAASGQLQCPKCLLVFKNSVEMRDHMRSNCASSILKCDHCLAVFFNKPDLVEHLKSKHFQFSNANQSDSSDIKNRKVKIIPSATTTTTTTVTNLLETNNNSASMINANLRHILSDSSMPSMAAAAAVAAVAAASASARAADSDLAAVSRILEAATRTNNFPQFFDLTDARMKSLEASLNKDVKPVLLGGDSNNDEAKQPHDGSNGSGECNTSLNFSKQDSSDVLDSLLSGDLSDSADASLDGGSKKKRNSYADSPHKLKCLYCTRAFPWISSLKRHILTHTGQKPYHCPQCPVTFSTKSNRERHMIRKHGLDIHDPATRQLMDRPFKCHLCVFSSFSSSGKLVRHFKSKHPDRQISEALLAKIPTMSQEELSVALSSITPNRSLSTEAGDNVSEQPDIEDDDDDEDDDSTITDDQAQADRLTMECLTSAGGYSASDPSLVLSGEGSASCGIGMSSVSTAVAVYNGTGAQSISNAALSIPIVKSKNNARSTPDSVASNEGRAINPERDNYNVDKITECWKCRKTFDSRKTLLRHLKEHSIDLPFKCYLCDASFTARLDSLQHKTAEHAGEWTVVQEKNKVGNLLEYAELMDKVVEDALAGNIVSRTHEGMELDIRPESDYAQRKVFCTLCPKRFWSLQDLRRHMRSHTGERPFECDICQARFTLKHSMMRHRRKHIDEVGDLGGLDPELINNTDDESSAQDNIEGESKAPLIKMDPLLMNMRKRSHPTNLSTLHGASLLKTVVQKKLKFTHDDRAAGTKSDQNEKGQELKRDGSTVESSDLLQNLLGIDDTSTIDHILDSPNDAASMLGMVETASDDKVLVKSEIC